MSSPSFNLWTEPWITVEDERGQSVPLSLQQTLLQAHQYRALYDSSPLVVVGIHRLLVAILQAALNPQDEADLANLWTAGQFPVEAIAAFGQKYAHRFDLFSETEPFMQSADLSLYPGKEDKAQLKSVANLLPEIPAGTAVTHYQHGDEDAAQFCPVTVAHGLVMIPAFATSGGAGIKPSINGVPPIYILPGGETLFQSLVASLIIPDYQPTLSQHVPDTPWWEHSSVVDSKKEVDQVGYLYSLTFPARRVRLHPYKLTKPCTHCGQLFEWGVSTMIYQMGESRPKDAPFWFDPFAAYRLPTDKNKNEEPKPIRPVEGRVLWREFSGLFLQSKEGHTRQPDILAQIARVIERHDVASNQIAYPFRCIGLRTDMKAKIFEWLDAGFAVSPTLLRDPDAGKLTQDAIDFALEGEKIIKQVFRHSFGGPSAKDERHQRTKANMGQAYWSKLTPYFYDFVMALNNPNQREQLARDWVETVVNTAQAAFREAAESLGDDAKALRQRVQGENYCRARLNKVRNEHL
ncbi:MAG: type I-E CRISPR-associated protein Cse1/CasA [Anaerolineae bacterium]|nr:type I-E CRISPR-associated protein Cse1/CasA [Anaerolineae bacterium]